jgi:hypothetical protein
MELGKAPAKMTKDTVEQLYELGVKATSDMEAVTEYYQDTEATPQLVMDLQMAQAPIALGGFLGNEGGNGNSGTAPG